jgi:hypothetical protein
MSSPEKLQQQLSSLEAELATLKERGDYLTGVRIERSPAGGSASRGAKESCKYARLRAGKGKLLPNGKRSIYIPVDRIAYYEAACDRGRQVHKLEQKIERLRMALWEMEQAQYRQWDGKSRQSKGTRKPKRVAPGEKVLEVEGPPPPLTTAAILVLYRQSSQTPVHAVGAEVWQGDGKIAEVKPVHCMGMRADKVADYIKQLLASLNQQYGVTKFEDVVKEVPVHHCPIEPCPLRG